MGKRRRNLLFLFLAAPAVIFFASSAAAVEGGHAGHPICEMRIIEFLPQSTNILPPIGEDTRETRVLSINGPARPSRPDSKIFPGVGGPTYWQISEEDMQRSAMPAPRGAFVRPVLGGYKSQGIHGYNAVDLALNCGRPVVAAAAGQVHRVRAKGWNGGYGKHVIIEHSDGTQTLYAHLRVVLVDPGQFIDQGFPVGLVGSTGHSTGCHVHFEVRGAKNPF